MSDLPTQETGSAIDTGDVVKHGPTGEEWTVAYVQGERLAWLGWPEGEANLSDCTLVRKVTPTDRDALLRRLAEMNRADARCRYARRRLANTEPAHV